MALPLVSDSLVHGCATFAIAVTAQTEVSVWYLGTHERALKKGCPEASQKGPWTAKVVFQDCYCQADVFVSVPVVTQITVPRGFRPTLGNHRRLLRRFRLGLLHRRRLRTGVVLRLGPAYRTEVVLQFGLLSPRRLGSRLRRRPAGRRRCRPAGRRRRLGSRRRCLGSLLLVVRNLPGPLFLARSPLLPQGRRQD